MQIPGSLVLYSIATIDSCACNKYSDVNPSGPADFPDFRLEIMFQFHIGTTQVCTVQHSIIVAKLGFGSHRT